ncbi:MAG: ABC transporter substrate-binding protein [Gallionellaceae bacterium]
MKNKIVALLGVLLLTVSFGVGADTPGPDALIRSTVDEVLAVVKQDKDIQAGNQKKILDLVDAKVLPHFDFERMTRLAVARGWRSATAEQKQQLITEFRTLLVRTYTSAFTRFHDQTVEIKPLRMQPGDDEVTVRTLIVKSGSQPISVDYEMEKTADGWKAFDLSVEGASLVTTYRGTFAEQIQQGGIDGLIKTLVDKNKAAANVPLNKADAK